MKYIKSSWIGFEIDSSEFSATLFTSDPACLIKAFFDSPFIEDRFNLSAKLIPRFSSAIEIAKKIDEELLERIKYNGANYKDFKEEMRNTKKLDKDQILDIVNFTQLLVKQFPDLVYELLPVEISFYRKTDEDEATEYSFSITGHGLCFREVLYNKEEWLGVLSSFNCDWSWY